MTDLPYLEDLGGGHWHVVIPCRHGWPPLRLKPQTLARYLAILEHAEICHDLLRQLDQEAPDDRR
jgi:hypothetical protein